MRLTRRSLIKATLASSVALAAPVVRAQQLRSIHFTLNFVPNGTNSPFYLAQKRGYFREAGFDVTLDAGNGADAINRLASGTHQAGFVDLGALTEFTARQPDGAPVGVFNVFSHSPNSIITWKAAQVKKPQDLAGKVMAAPVTDTPTRLFPVFAKLNGIDPSTVSLKVISMQLREALLKDHNSDGAFGYDVVLLPNLISMGIEPTNFDIMYYSDYGLNLYSATVAMTRSFIAADRGAATALLGAISRAWVDAIKDPAATNAALVAAQPLANSDLELMRLKWVLEKHVVTADAKNGGLGGVDKKRLSNNIQTIVGAFNLPNMPSADALFDDSLLPERQLRTI